MFSVANLSIRTSEKSLVNQLSFTMQAGERWVVLGANGCGKSSLLQACAGLPTAGRAVHFDQLSLPTQHFQFGQHTPAALAPLRSVCPQRLDWNTSLTPLQLAGLLDIDLKALDVPASWLHQALSQRSGGEQQRIAIALTTAQAQALCFLDEPLTHLDEVQKLHTLTQLKTMGEATGKSLLMVSHHIRLSVAWASHVLLPAGDGAWLAGDVASICTAENIATAYDISLDQAQRLLDGQALFNALSLT
jgi:iron complex transport system ATP-binding protein